jgi:hypothetical protein
VTTVVVARLRGGCRICGLPDVARTAISAAIWPEGAMAPRAKDYRAAAVLAGLEHAISLNVKSVTTHAHHVEQTWRIPTVAAPPSGTEVDVFDIGLDAMTERAAHLGARAMVEIETAMPEMEARDLIQVAKMGVTAVEKREALRLKDRRPNINVLAIFGLVSGHVPTNERAEDAYPVELLEAELNAERGAYAVRDD